MRAFLALLATLAALIMLAFYSSAFIVHQY